MTPDQLRAARGLLGWGIQKLAARSRTTYHMVDIYERTGRVAVTYGRRSLGDPLVAIQAVLEQAGIEFMNGDASGVRLREHPP